MSRAQTLTVEDVERLTRLPPFEEYYASLLADEAKLDADLRAGIFGGAQMPYRYVGPPMIPTSETTARAMYEDAARAREQALRAYERHRAAYAAMSQEERKDADGRAAWFAQLDVAKMAFAYGTKVTP